MASIYPDSSRNGWRVQLYVRGVRRKLWIGPISKSAARAVAVHLDNINRARDTGTVAPADTRRWLVGISPRIRNRLAAWGLVDQQAAAKSLPRTLGAYTQAHIDSRDDWKASSRRRMSHVRRKLTQQLGPDTPLAAITPGDAQRFARWCRSNLSSQSHSGKTIADARQFFKAAIDDRLIAENPFAGIDSSQAHDKAREAYVTRESADALIALADPYYAAVIASARYGGLRVPSEPLELTWTDIDWATNRFQVRSSKLAKHHNAVRTVPLFPELRPHLELLFELAPDGAQRPFARYRSTAGSAYRQMLERLIKRAGIPQWPKLWMNLRASCRTDLLERFPSHVVDAWLGHSGKVGAKHYDRIHDGHFAAAACGVAGGVVTPPLPASDRQPNQSQT